MRVTSIAALVVLLGCTEHGKSPNDGGRGTGGPDARRAFPDAPQLCPNPDDRPVSGELVDLDSSSNAFLAVPGAQLALAGAGTEITTDMTGHFSLCADTSSPMTFEYDAPNNYLDGTIIIDPSALVGLVPISLRTFTTVRAPSFFQSLGLSFNASKGQVLVFQAGDRFDISLDRTHGTTQSGVDDNSPGNFTWMAGDFGRYVLFPNVDTASSTGTVSVAGAPFQVPIEAGKLTILTVALVLI